MNELLRDAIKWLIGGGALALATLAGTTAYQNGQLEIEQEKNLRQFLDKYVEIAVKGSLDERIRFVSYWDSLKVQDKIGVDFALYRAALTNEIETGIAESKAQAAALGNAPPAPAPAKITSPVSATGVRQPATGDATPNVEDSSQPSQPSGPPQPSTTPREDQVASDSMVQQRPPQQQQAYFEARQDSVGKLAVPDLERAGFQALLDRKVDVALENFRRAYDLWPDFHNLSEIVALLEASVDRLRAGDAETWRNTYRRILSSYAWGLPKELRAPFEKAASG